MNLDNMNTTTSDIKKGPILFVMILGAFLATLNQTVMTVAIPELIRGFGITASSAQWLTTGYMLVNGILIPITAFLIHRFSTRQLFQASMWIFLVGTIVSAVAPGFPLLLTGRMIQAAGAGIIMPLLMNVILTIFPPNNRGVAMGMVGLAIIFAPAIGPVIAGYILESYSWKTMFYCMIPFAVLVISFGFFCLKNVSNTVKAKLDIVSVLLSTVAFGSLLFGFSRAGNQGWGSIQVIITITLGTVSLAFFIYKQFSSETPLLDLRAFSYKMFTLATGINVAVTMVMYADMMLLPLYLQNARGYTALESGLLMLPGAIIMGILMPVAGKLFDRFGAKWLAIIGLMIIIITTIGFINLTDTTSYTYLVLMSTGRRIGIALLMMPVQTAGLNQLPARLNAHGTAIANTIRQVAGAIGTSLLVTIMTDRSKFHFTELMAKSTITGITKERMIMKAAIQGINDSYVVIIGFAVIALFLSFFIKHNAQASNKESEVEGNSIV